MTTQLSTRAHIKHTEAALERYDAATLRQRQVLADVRRSDRGLLAIDIAEDHVRYCQDRVASALRDDTGRSFFAGGRDLESGLRAAIARDLAASTTLRHAHDHTTHPAEGVHILDGWCPNCGAGARGALADWPVSR